MHEPKEGGCQCGKVRYRIDEAPLVVVACHCTECQRQSGSAFGMTMVVKADAFAVTRGEPRSYSRKADSGNMVEGVFCADCGTRLFHRPAALPVTVNVKPGTLDDTSWFEPAMSVWEASKHPWVALPDALRTFEQNPTKPGEEA